MEGLRARSLNMLVDPTTTDKMRAMFRMMITWKINSRREWTNMIVHSLLGRWLRSIKGRKQGYLCRLRLKTIL